MNSDERSELYMMEEGELKVTWKWDTRVPNCAMFYFVKEDHTLAGMLRSELLRHPHVIFSGYRVPHPLYATFDLRIQTDGEVTPKKALMDTCKSLLQKLSSLDLQFKHEFAIREAMNHSRATGTGGAGPSGTGGEAA